MVGEASVVRGKRRPSVVGAGLLVVVCLFLPTLRVCGEPTAPIEFPPLYFVYVGSAIIAYFGMSPALRRARNAIAGWFLLWGLGATAVLTVLATEGVNGAVGFAVAVFGATGIGVLLNFVHKKQLADRGMFAIGVVQGLIVTGWYIALASGKNHMWGAYVGLVAGFIQTITSAMALSSAHAEQRDQRPAFPVARLIQ